MVKGAVSNVASHDGTVSAPLILAIQPDRRQASQLSAIAKRISAELVLTESAARAVAVLGERLPDLILTPPLLSHKDEKAITERLHEFGDAGAHIQTLTIPIFETTEAPASKGGVLSSLRKPKRKGKASATDTAGSAADTFAEQVSIYLVRAVEVRQASMARKLSAQARPAMADPPPPEQPSPQPQETAAWQPQPGPTAAQPPEGAPWETDRHTAGTLPTIEELSARTPAVPEPDRSVETRIATIATAVPTVDLTPAPATPVDTRMDTLATLVPVMSRTVQEAALPVPVPARTLVAQLAMELRAAELASPAEHAVPALPALPAASLETSVDVAAMAPVDEAASEPAAVPTPDATPLAAVRVDLSSMPLDEAPSESAAVPMPQATTLATLRVDLSSMPLEQASESAAVPMPQATTLAALRVDLSSMPLDEARSESAVSPMPEGIPLAALRVDLPAVVSLAEAASDRATVPMPDATSLASLRVNLPATDIATGELAAIPALPGRAIETDIDAVAAMTPLVNASADACAVPAVASIPYVTQLPMELWSLTATDLHDVESLVSSPPVASAEMNVTAFVPMGLGEGTSMARAVPIPDATPQVATLAMTIQPVDIAPEPAVLPLVPDATAAAMSMQVVAGIVTPASGHSELALPQPETIAPPDIAVQLSPADIAAPAGNQTFATPELPAQPAERMTEALAAIVPLGRVAEHTVPVPMPTLVPYVAELPIQLPTMAVTGAAGRNIFVVPAPPATVARTGIDTVAAMMAEAPTSADGDQSAPAGPPAVLPVRKKARKQLSLKDRKAARKASKARTDRLDDSSLFNPDECRFAALVAKLDEVAPGLDESHAREGAPASQSRKRRASKRR